jgi:hypothetical protein
MTSVLNKDGFAALIATLASVNPEDVVWDPSPDFAMASPETATKITLTLFNIAAQGVDEHRVAFNPGGYPANSLVTTEIGNREVTINCLVEVYDRDREAAEIIDAIRTGIRAASSTGALNALNLAYEWSNKTIRFAMQREQRVVSAATADFMFGGIAQLVSAIANDGNNTVASPNPGWIDDLDGVPLAEGGLIPGTFTE